MPLFPTRPLGFLPTLDIGGVPNINPLTEALVKQLMASGYFNPKYSRGPRRPILIAPGRRAPSLPPDILHALQQLQRFHKPSGYAA